MSSKALIIDAGVGNLGNLARAVRYAGTDCEITREPSRIAAGRCLLLPGVGAFRPPRETLRGPMEGALNEALAAGAWLLGICVGYQLLFEAGEEHGASDGLGLLPGVVQRLPEAIGEAPVALPHIGWNRLRYRRPHALFEGIPDGSYFYFVHSYAPIEIDSGAALATAEHGAAFVAVAGRDRVLGTQFHPEKSGHHGLRLLANYLGMAS
ncbi:MAG: imidazole glycerol phosphate synthase subunit HisH [Thermoanaerobaculia bacterium]